MIKYISFDFWNTLATPNPEFSRLRNQHLAGFFGLGEHEIKLAYTRAKTLLDKQAEETGWQDGVIHAYFALFREVGFKGMRQHAEALNTEVSRLFLENPPIFPEGLFKTLRDYTDKGFKINIISNTNFISGTVILEVLKNTGVTFTETLFSDLMEIAKPNPEIFKELAHCLNVHPGRIIHIGDNLYADIYGAKKAGYDSWRVVDPKNTVDTLNSEIFKLYLKENEYSLSRS
jgi:putative hydrolase of the HAD superfamily